MKNVAIVIVNYNGEEDTIECLNSINQLVMDDFKLLVIIVDNGSLNELEIPHSEFKIGELIIIRNQKNSGFAGGNNIGIKYALKQNADFILLLNNDTIIDKNLIKELLKIFESKEKIGIVAPKIYFAKGFEFHKDRYKKEELGKIIWYAGGKMDFQNIIGYHRGVDKIDKGQYDKIEETDFASGCCMLIRKEVFEKIGLLDERYFLYYEDNDFSQRVKKGGYKIMYTQKAIIWHKNAGSAGGSGSSLQDYYITRNRLLFGFQYGQIRTRLAFIRESLKLLLFGRPWQRRGIMDFYFRNLGKGTYQ